MGSTIVWSDADTVARLGGGTNLVLQAEDFGVTWTVVIGTPTRVAAAHTASGVTLDLLGDDDAASAEGYTQTIPFGADDGVKAVSIHAKQDTATAFTVQLFDATAAANRVRMTFGWSAGLPTLVSAINGTYLGYETLVDGVFRLLASSESVVPANTNSLRVRPASTNLAVADIGTTYLGGAQVEHSSTPGPYVKTTTAPLTGLSNSKVRPMDRFSSWSPRSRPIGPAEHAVGTGQRHVFPFRTDHAASFEIRNIPNSSMSLMLRLEEHLLKGGLVALHTGDSLNTIYPTCSLAPDSAPSIGMSDPQELEYTFSVSLLNVATVPSRMFAMY